MKIVIEFIDHEDQRYETCGDYWLDADGVWQFRVSKTQAPGELGETIHPFLVLIHELTEWMKEVIINKIPVEQIDDFDTKFELLRTQFPELIGDMEPGDMIEAPYHRGHVVGTYIEKVLVEEFGIDWKMYEQYINLLKNGKTLNPNK